MSYSSSDNNSKSEQVPAWLVTFADAMSLLLAFFVLLFSFSDISPQKIVEMSSSSEVVSQGQAESDIETDERVDVGGQTGEDVSGSSELKQGELSEKKQDVASPKDKGDVEEEFGATYLKKVFTKGVRNLSKVAEVDISELEEGYNIFFNLKKIFEKDQVAVAENKQEIVIRLAKLLAKLPNDIIVESFYLSKAKDNDLAVELAIKRMEYLANLLIEKGGLIPSRVGISESSAFTDLYYTYSWQQRRKYCGIRIMVSPKNEGYKYFLRKSKKNERGQ